MLCLIASSGMGVIYMFCPVDMSMAMHVPVIEIATAILGMIAIVLDLRYG